MTNGSREAPQQAAKTAMKPQERTPQTGSISELAHFGDTHDLTDFEEELEEVEEPVLESGAPVILRLDSAEAATVKRLAESRGGTDTDLIHQWVVERIARA
jgi:hypothetical protein